LTDSVTPTSDVPFSSAGTPNRHHPVRARRIASLSRPQPDQSVNPSSFLARTRSETCVSMVSWSGAFAPMGTTRRHRCPRLRFRRLTAPPSETTCMTRTALTHPRKGMTQPRSGTPSTVSTTRELAPSSQSAVNSGMNHDDALHTFSPRDLVVGRASAVFHGASLLSECRFDPPCDEPLRLPRDACDRLLPSTSSISSTRASFASDEIASPTREMFGLASSARLDGVASRRADDRRAQRFHDAWPASACRMVCDLFHRSNVEAFSSSNFSFAIGRASDAPVAPPALRRLERSLSQRPTPEDDAEVGGRRLREETAAPRPSAPSVERCFFFGTAPCDARPRNHTGLGPLITSLLGSHGFAAV